jgi:predicted amidophosphoribosyltransferase
MANFTPRRIIGKWREGFALDLHTLGSTFLGYDEFGHPKFDTQRSEIGNLLYRLKYQQDQQAAVEIARAACDFLVGWKPGIDVLVPVPASTQRAVQPVAVVAQAIGVQMELPVVNAVSRKRGVPQLKNVFDLDERARLLEGLHTIDPAAVTGKRVLLFDDLFRSGATMNAIATAMVEEGRTADVFALTLTRTRSNQ